MSGLAVLLIIGSAVVGPIEAQELDYKAYLASINACAKPIYADLLTEWNRSHKSPIYSSGGHWIEAQAFCFDRITRPDTRYETLPQLCERAMQEIGAGPNENTAAVEPYKSMWYLLRVTSGVASKGFDVLCIPVPQGYRK